MKLQIFDVEHGACALLTCDDNTRLMIDCGHNATNQWYPGSYLRTRGINRVDMLAVTNYDEDHVSGIGNLLDNVNVGWLHRNTSVSTATLRNLKREHGMGAGITRLCDAIDNVFTGDGTAPQPTFAGLERQWFRNAYPTFTDENNLSLAYFLSCHGKGVLFTGDLEPAGWTELLKSADFKSVCGKTNVLVAPHHGRIDERDRPFFRDTLKPLFPNVFFVVISDKGYMYDTQQTIPIYRGFAKGGKFRGQEARQVLTTRSDGAMEFSFSPQGWYAS